MEIYSLWNKHFSSSLESLDVSQNTLDILNKLITEYLPKDHTDFQKQLFVSANRGMICNYLVDSIDVIDFKNASKMLFDVDSFNRPELLVKFSDMIDKSYWLKLFNDFWTMCDSCSIYHEEFKEAFSKYTIEELRNEIHSDEDKEFYDSLPDVIEIYRGTFNDIRFSQGISWTLDKDVANRFMMGYKSFAENGPMVYRYKMNMTQDKFDLLKDISEEGVSVLTRTVNKKDIFLMTSRGEHEVIVLN